MRGKAAETLTDSGWIGITPAYAGKRRKKRRNFPANWDHPRLCGEKLSGSTQQQRRRRITPAYAGKSGIITVEVSYMQDHPRLCGEKLLCYVPLPAGIGSPPPMRGKGKEIRTECCNRRITPAYAGKSSRLPFIPTSFQDHPRLCGEKFFVPHVTNCRKGSPPPMRGKAWDTIKNVWDTGITPAYAGKRRVRYGRS